MAVGGSTGATVERPRLGFRLSVGGWAAGDIAPRRLFGQSYTFFPALIPSLFPLVGCQRLRTIIWSGCGALPPANRFSGSEGVWRRYLEDAEELHRAAGLLRFTLVSQPNQMMVLRLWLRQGFEVYISAKHKHTH